MSLESDLYRLERVNVLMSVLSLTALLLYHLLTTVFLLLTPRRYRRRKDVSGQRILITGAGNGIGRQLAIQFSKKSVYLLLLDVDGQALQETCRLLDPAARTYCYVCDVTRREEVYAVVKLIKDEAGEVDILVNNAGVVSGKSFIDLPDDSIQRTMEVNVISHFWICKAFLPSMMARNSGHIVSVSSIAGQMSFPKLVDYCASKYAVVGLSEAIEVEMRAKKLDGIKVTVVCPYVINTGMFRGVKSGLYKTCSVEYAAEEILEGILREDETVFIPGYFRYLSMLKSVIPRWLYCTYLETTHSMHLMDSFIGKTNACEG